MLSSRCGSSNFADPMHLPMSSSADHRDSGLAERVTPTLVGRPKFVDRHRGPLTGEPIYRRATVTGRIGEQTKHPVLADHDSSAVVLLPGPNFAQCRRSPHSVVTVEEEEPTGIVQHPD